MGDTCLGDILQDGLRDGLQDSRNNDDSNEGTDNNDDTVTMSKAHMDYMLRQAFKAGYSLGHDDGRGVRMLRAAHDYIKELHPLKYNG